MSSRGHSGPSALRPVGRIATALRALDNGSGQGCTHCGASLADHADTRCVGVELAPRGPRGADGGPMQVELVVRCGACEGGTLVALHVFDQAAGARFLERLAATLAAGLDAEEL